MFRTLTTIGVLLLVGKSFLIDKGVPVDGIVEHGGQTINAPFDWDRYDAASAALIAFMGWNVWRKRPKWARFLARRKARKQDKREAELWQNAREPMAAYRDKRSDRLYELRAEVIATMRKGVSRLTFSHHLDDHSVRDISRMLSGEFPGITVRADYIDWSTVGERSMEGSVPFDAPKATGGYPLDGERLTAPPF